MSTTSIAVFDVCGTITKTNNTFEFVRFALRRESMLRYGLLALIRLVAAFFGLLGLRSIFGKDRLRDAQVALLRGYAPARIEEMAKAYVERLFARRLLNERVLRAMRREKKLGRTVCLVSAAIDPPVAALAEKLGIGTYFCSQLDVRDGRYTGRLRTDLIGRKESILQYLPGDVDMENSSAYTDNVTDAGFLNRFGHRTVVLNTAGARRQWSDRGRFHYLVNYDESPPYRDVDSVNPRTVRWIYVPALYYVISRFHRTGLRTLVFREVLPATLASFLFTGLGASAFVLIPLSFLVFYSVYEIGGLFNDLVAKPAGAGNDTRRISQGVRVRIGPFLAIRAAGNGLILAYLSSSVPVVLIYLGALCTCLGIYAIHSLTAARWRIVTFVLLKICRNCIPLIVLVDRVPATTVLFLCAIFFALDAPWRVYSYSIRHGLVSERIAVWHLRFVNAAILCGLGAVLYLAAGPSHLLVIASYYVALDCLWFLRGR